MDLREQQGGSTPNRHPWERSRARAVERLLEGAGLPPSPRLLDVGCGDGWLLVRLGGRLGASAVVGVDPALDEPTRQRLEGQRPPAHAVTHLASVPERSFDLALLLDVLEHEPDDLGLLRRTADRVVSGGQVLITVPAHPRLFGEHDRQLLHLRRYSRRALARLVEEAGLEPLETGSLFGSLILPRGALLLAERLGARAGLLATGGRPGRVLPRWTGVGAWRRGPALTRTILVALDLDNRLLSALSQAGIPCPGLSLVARCRKP